MKLKSDKKLVIEAFFVALSLIVISIGFGFGIMGKAEDPVDFQQPLQPLTYEVVPLVTETSEDDSIECLALNIYFEARNDNLAGRVAVADVVMNRARDDRYPDSICAVVKQARLSDWWLKEGKKVPLRNQCQFSWFCDGMSDEPLDGATWQECLLLATNMILYGEYRGITEGATHYHATYVNPRWIRDRGMHVIGRIGEHIFYRWG